MVLKCICGDTREIGSEYLRVYSSFIDINVFSVLQPFDLNEVDIMVSFPERYPQEVCMFEMF